MESMNSITRNEIESISAFLDARELSIEKEEYTLSEKEVKDFGSEIKMPSNSAPKKIRRRHKHRFKGTPVTDDYFSMKKTVMQEIRFYKTIFPKDEDGIARSFKETLNGLSERNIDCVRILYEIKDALDQLLESRIRKVK